jgi:hypothetical protein
LREEGAEKEEKVELETTDQQSIDGKLEGVIGDQRAIVYGKKIGAIANYARAVGE